MILFNNYVIILKKEVINLKIIVYKENETLEVLLLKHKNTEKYSFVNVTKGHICRCIFQSKDEALEDIETRKKKGLLLDYKIIEEGE